MHFNLGIMAAVTVLALVPSAALAAPSSYSAAAPANKQTDLRCWQGASNCWGPWDYAFPDVSIWNAEAGSTQYTALDGSHRTAFKSYPPPTLRLSPADGGTAGFPLDDASTYWGQIPFDGRWAWLNRPTAFASVYERGPSVGGAFGALAATQDGINPTPILQGAPLDHFFNPDGSPQRG